MAQRRGLFARENKATVQKRSGNRDVKTGNPGDQAFVWSADCSKLVFVFIQIYIFFSSNYFIIVQNGNFVSKGKFGSLSARRKAEASCDRAALPKLNSFLT